MAEVTRRKEVSCLALTFFYDYLEEHGIARRRLQEGLPYTPEYLDSRINWIDYATFLEIERRMAKLLPRPDLFFDIGLTFAATRGFGFLRVIWRSVASPAQVYMQLPRLVKRFLFPFVDIRMERVDPGTLRGTYTFDEGYTPSQAFLDVVRGILTGAPAMLGAPHATVSMERTGPLQAVFDIRLATYRRAGLPAIDRIRKRIVETGRIWWHNLSDVAGELEETNRLLQEQVDALTDAKAQLDRKVRDLTILNTVSRAATSGALEIPRVLQNVVRVLHSQLGEIPAAVLLAEGEPRRMVIATSVAFSRELEDAVGGERLEHLLLTREPDVISAGARHLRVLPMVSRNQVVAALAVADVDSVELPLLESVASQLAVIIDNAISYQTITDLRDNLEIRVRERTAELEEARGQLEDTVERLKRSDRARTEFFTNVSHELRTPLTLILAPLDALDAALSGADESVRGDLRIIRENAGGLLRIINEILDFARLDAERMPVHPERLSVSGLVEDVVASLRPLADRKRVQLTWHSPGEPVEALVDPKLTRRVVANLVGNGIKYVEEGQRVEVSVGVDRGEVAIKVTDTGPGIPLDAQSKIFERFQRVPDSRGRIIEGSGIGLAMVKEIVALHGGSVSLDSRPGEGATFIVRIPKEGTLAHEVGEPAPLPDELTPGLEALPVFVERPTEAPSGDGARARLLLVEDNPEMQGFLSRLLSPRYRVSVAGDGEEGFRLAREQLPEVIVSDVMMPRVDGLEMCRRLKADALTRQIPVLLLSARHGADAALEGFGAGADDYVVKPFSSPELLARVEAQLRIRRLALAVMRMEKQTTLGLLSAGIAHEVRNPVNAVMNAVPPLRKSLGEMRSLVNGSATTEMADALLDSIERSGHRIRHIVDSMLALSRQEPEKLRLRETNLEEGLNATLELLRFRVSDGVTIHREYEWHGTVWCYPDLVNQVVMNLLVNALDSVNPREGNVWIRLRCDGEAVRLEVSDDGPGVPGELRERIFEPFFTTKAPGAGTGLGLAVSREIMSLHGGSIELEPGDHGATFVVTLPLGESSQFRSAPAIQLGAPP